MGQERFADIVERFTNGHADGVGASAESVRQWQEEIDRTLRRFHNLGEMVSNPVEPRTGVTPREEVYRRNKSRLYRYQSCRRTQPPVPSFPNLAISPPTIFDLFPAAA